MKRKQTMLLVTAASGLVLLGFLLLVGHYSTRKPNILLITLDTTRADHLGCYGYTNAITPALDSLAARGTLFERAYCTVPLTLPSHTTILTGLLPPEHGLRVNALQSLPSDIPTLAQILTTNGYETAAFVATSILAAKYGLSRGFSTYDDNMPMSDLAVDDGMASYRVGNKVADACLTWLKQKRRQPFFCWVHFYDPHVPYHAHEDLFGQRFIKSPYDAGIAFADIQVGRIISSLKEQHTLDNTLIVVTADHGESLPVDHFEPYPHHGLMVYDGTTRVPLIYVLPRTIPAGRRASELVSNVDIVPTILDVVKLPKPELASSISLSPLFDGTTPYGRSSCYVEADLAAHSGWSGIRSLITENWKFMRTAKPELYNLQSDPGETNNLVRTESALAHGMDADLSALESSLVRRTGDTTKITAAERRRIESLGYVSGEGASLVDGERRPLQDVKDMLPVYEKNRVAQKLFKSGLFIDAMALWQEVVKISPETPSFRNALGCAQLECGHIDQAIVCFDKLLKDMIVEEHSSVPSAMHEAERPVYTLVLNNLAYAKALGGKFDEALPLSLEATETDPMNPEYLHTLTTIYRGLRQLDTAEKYAILAASVDQSNPKIVPLLVAVLLENGKSDKAIKVGSQALGYLHDAKAISELKVLVQKAELILASQSATPDGAHPEL